MFYRFSLYICLGSLICIFLNGCTLSNNESVSLDTQANILDSQGKYSQASKIRKKIVQREPECEMCWFLYAGSLMKEGKFDKALKVIDKNSKKFPQSSKFSYLKAIVYLENNIEYTRAGYYLNKTYDQIRFNLDHAEDKSSAWEDWVLLNTSAYMHKAQYEFLMGDLKKAKKVARSCSKKTSYYDDIVVKLYGNDEETIKEFQEVEEYQNETCRRMVQVIELVESGKISLTKAQAIFKKNMVSGNNSRFQEKIKEHKTDNIKDSLFRKRIKIRQEKLKGTEWGVSYGLGAGGGSTQSGY